MKEYMPCSRSVAIVSSMIRSMTARWRASELGSRSAALARARTRKVRPMKSHSALVRRIRRCSAARGQDLPRERAGGRGGRQHGERGAFRAVLDSAGGEEEVESGEPERCCEEKGEDQAEDAARGEVVMRLWGSFMRMERVSRMWRDAGRDVEKSRRPACGGVRGSSSSQTVVVVEAVLTGSQ